jgi:hypothetical protein
MERYKNAKKELPRISDAEWEVMEVIRNNDKITSQGIIEQLGDTGWSPVLAGSNTGHRVISCRGWQ